MKSVIPGFGLTLGLTLSYLGLLVIIPLATLFFKAASLGLSEFWQVVVSDRALAAYRLSFGGALAASLLNLGFGTLLAWVLVRYDFWGKKLINALIDLPFALPTAVAGIAITTLFAKDGALGSIINSWGVKVVFTPLGVILTMVFVSLPFVVRTVEPVLEDIDAELEEAASSLGASRWQSFALVIFPLLLPALLTGFAMALARAVGEYGSIIFIAGNMPGRTEIAPLLIIIKLEQYDYAGATAIAVFMLFISFGLLLGINLLQRWQQSKQER